MRRLVGLVAALTLVFALAPATATAEKLHEPHPRHWNTGSQAGEGRCPDGITVRLGGGAGWKASVRASINRWNETVAPGYPAAPFITSVIDVPWDAATQYYPCTVDVDEVYDHPYSDGTAWVIYHADGHYGGARIELYTTTWFEQNSDFMHDYITFHELSHTMGLGHNDRQTSVMSYWYRCICHDGGDYETLKGLYSHRNLHWNVW